MNQPLHMVSPLQPPPTSSPIPPSIVKTSALGSLCHAVASGAGQSLEKGLQVETADSICENKVV